MTCFCNSGFCYFFLSNSRLFLAVRLKVVKPSSTKDSASEEKEYDRNTSIGTLKLILKLGFKIGREKS